jgi:hypothetical protein
LTPLKPKTDCESTAIAQAAAELDRLRTNWLNPPEWTREEILEFPGSLDGPWARFIESAKVAPPRREGAASGGARNSKSGSGDKGGSTGALVPDGVRDLHCVGDLHCVRYPRLVPKDAACAKELKKRTLTNLYNQRPQWLALAHEKLDAVFAAYGWPVTLSDDDLLAKLLALNLERAK